MYQETFDFYDSTSIKIYNLDKKIRYELSILDRLDPMTKRHSENVGNLTGRICQYLRLNKQFTVHAIICGYLHDIGKSQIPYEILSKDGPLTNEEFEVMKTHTTLGYNICMKDLRLRPYAEGALYHHEALNGTGYPQGLKKEDIPFVARIIRVADEYDAIVSKRQYKTHIGISDTLKLIIENAQPGKGLDKSSALSEISSIAKLGKVNPIIVKCLFKVVLDDIYYEITCTQSYLDDIQDDLNRFKQIEKYEIKMNEAKTEKKKNYYMEGIKILLKKEETFEDYKRLYAEYSEAYTKRKAIIDNLWHEAKIIKKLKV